MSLPRPTLRLLHFRTTASATTNFSTSAPSLLPRRITRDRNPNRGVSAVRRQPHKEPVSVEKYGLPQPVLDPERLTAVVTDEDHGLWGFFHDKKPLPTPDEDHQHGRAWSVQELRQKSWDDLHCLWWKCVLERNIQETQALERKRLKPGYGAHEATERKDVVKKTMRGIKHVLTERYYSWEEAKVLAEKDPEINLSGSGPVYTPKPDLEERDGLEVPSETQTLLGRQTEKTA